LAIEIVAMPKADGPGIGYRQDAAPHDTRGLAIAVFKSAAAVMVAESLSSALCEINAAG